MNFISRKIINKYFLIPLYFIFFNNIKLNSLFYIIVIIIYIFLEKTKHLYGLEQKIFKTDCYVICIFFFFFLKILCHMYYCLMKNVLNSFKFTFATCKHMLMRMLLLTDINIYYLIIKKYIFITLPWDRSNKLGMPYFIFHTFPKRKILWVSIPVSVQLVLRHRPDHQVRLFC